MSAKFKHSDLTDEIIGVFYEVYNLLGYGFLEKVYEVAMFKRLTKAGLQVEAQKRIQVFLDGEVIGEYFADLVINEFVILELKAAETLISIHEAQLLNYLRATNYEVGLLLNFGPKPQIRRKAYDNENKPNLSSSD